MVLSEANPVCASSASSATAAARGQDAAADDDHVPPGQPDHLTAGDVPLRVERAGLDLPLLTGRRRLRSLQLAEAVHGPVLHDPQVPRARDRRGGQCRPDAGDLDVARPPHGGSAARSETAEGQDGPRPLSLGLVPWRRHVPT